MTNNSYINALSVCDLLHTLSAKHAGEAVTLFLDNARYQKCRLVQALAAQLKIERIYLPAYSPNLNLIERLWRHVKQPEVSGFCNGPWAMRLGLRVLAGVCANLGKPHQNSPYLAARYPPKGQNFRL